LVLNQVVAGLCQPKNKIVHNVRDEMAEFVVPLKKEIEDSLTMQGLQNIMGLHRKRLAQFKLLSR